MLSRTPPSTDFLQPTKYKVDFPRIMAGSYFCQVVNIPGITASSVRQTTPFVDLHRPGDKVDYGMFSMTFIVDDGLWGWQILHDWIRGFTFPETFEEYKNLDRLSEINLVLKNPRPQYADGQLTILSGTNIPKYRIKFVDMFPTSLSDIVFDTEQSADTILKATCQFRYQLYNVERIILNN
ncbi:MAG: hypothetical protein ACM31H_02820 [Nitrososphaerales archaeon]